MADATAPATAPASPPVTPEPAPAAPAAIAPVVVAEPAPATPPAENLADTVAALRARIAALEAPVPAPAAPAVAPAPGHCAVWRATAASWSFAKAGAAVLKGLRTILFFSTAGGLAMAQEFGEVDLTPVLQMILPEGSKVSVSQAVILMSVAGIGFRLITKTAAFARWRTAATPAGDGVAPGVGSGGVDDPEGQ